MKAPTSCAMGETKERGMPAHGFSKDEFNPSGLIVNNYKITHVQGLCSIRSVHLCNER